MNYDRPALPITNDNPNPSKYEWKDYYIAHWEWTLQPGFWKTELNGNKPTIILIAATGLTSFKYYDANHNVVELAPLDYLAPTKYDDIGLDLHDYEDLVIESAEYVSALSERLNDRIDKLNEEIIPAQEAVVDALTDEYDSLVASATAATNAKNDAVAAKTSADAKYDAYIQAHNAVVADPNNTDKQTTEVQKLNELLLELGVSSLADVPDAMAQLEANVTTTTNAETAAINERNAKKVERDAAQVVLDGYNDDLAETKDELDRLKPRYKGMVNAQKAIIKIQVELDKQASKEAVANAKVALEDANARIAEETAKNEATIKEAAATKAAVTTELARTMNIDTSRVAADNDDDIQDYVINEAINKAGALQNALVGQSGLDTSAITSIAQNPIPDVGSVVDGAVGTVTGAVDTVTNAGTSIVNGAVSSVSGLGTAAANLGPGLVKNVEDCFKSIVDLSIQKIMEMIMGLIDSINAIPIVPYISSAISALMATIMGLYKSVMTIYQNVVSIIEDGLAGLVAKFQTAVMSYVEKLEIVQQISGMVNNATDFIENLANFNPCDLLGVSGMPAGTASKHTLTGLGKSLYNMNPQPRDLIHTKPDEKPKPEDDFKTLPIPPTPVDYAKVNRKNSSTTMKSRILDSVTGFAANPNLSMAEQIKAENMSHMAARTLLDMVDAGTYSPTTSRAYIKSQYDVSGDDLSQHFKDTLSGQLDSMLNVVEGSFDSVKESFNDLKYMFGGHDDDNDYEPAKKKTDMDLIRERNNIIGNEFKNLVLTGGIDVDYVKFLELIPSDRPQYIKDMWVKWHNKDIERDEKRLDNRNILHSYRHLDEFKFGQTKMPYESGKTLVTNLLPIGTKLVMYTKDATIYDPTGNNPTGEVIVVGHDDDTIFNQKIGLYVSREDKEKIQKNQLHDIRLQLVETGDNNAKDRM